jgi:hypothetical protein
MIRRRRQLRFPGASGAAGNDTDALQTDVMRFMAIIGLCLMAVFALVQSIPLQGPGKPVQLEDLELQLQHGRRALAEIEQVSMQEQQNLKELRGRLLATQQQLDQSRKAVAAIKRVPLAQTAKAVVEKRPVPAPAAKAVIEKRPVPAPVAKPVIEKRPVPAPVAKPVVEKRPAPAPATKPVIRKRPPPPAPIAKPLPARQGYSLRFASAAALDRQVAAGSVSLYGMLDQQAWQFSMLAGSPAAVAVSLPKWFHEMSAATVPTHYLHSLKNKADGRGPSAVVWGVQLPAATSTAIASLLQERQAQGQQGGALVIQGDGQVTLEQ